MSTIMNLDDLMDYEAEGWDTAKETRDPDQWERLGRLAFSEGYRAVDTNFLVKSTEPTATEAQVADGLVFFGTDAPLAKAFAKGWEAARYAHVVDRSQHQLFGEEA